MALLITKRSYILFFVLFLLFAISGRIWAIPAYELISMIGLGLASFIYILHNNTLGPYRIFISTLLFQLICSLLLKTEFIFFSVSDHGPSADDGILYFEYASKGASMSVSAFLNSFSDTQWNNIDDYGFLFYLRAICILFPSFLVPFILLLLNAIYIAIGAVAIMKTIRLLDINDKYNVAIAISIFSSFLFFVNSSAVGLKEDLFVPIICLVFYYMTSFYQKRRAYDFLSFIFWISLTVFFRTSITLILLVVFSIGLISTKSNRKTIVFGFLVAVLFSPLIIDFFLNQFLGVSLETIVKVADARYRQTESDSTSKQIGDMIAAFIGPFPNYTSSIDSIFYCYSSLLKMILNLPVLWAVIMIFKNFMYKYYFVALYYVIGIMMTLVSGTGLDLRYHIPFFVSFIILLQLFLNSFYLKKIVWIAYLSVCFVIVFFYNILK